MHKMMRISAGNVENSSSTSLVLGNNDLLIKILLCLPVKSLLVLKAVSKHWYSLICDSYFMQKHCQPSTNKLSVSGLYFLRLNSSPTNEHHIPSYGMLLLDKTKISSTNVSFVIQVNERPVGLYISQSCNGLLLCHRHLSYDTGTRYIYNPSTRHYRTIPPPPSFQQDNMNLGPSYCRKFYLAFSPNKSLNYEIVFLQRTGSVHQMAVYSSNTGLWRFCGYVELDLKLLSRQCVSWNGCLNWVTGYNLYYFNIAQQVLKTSRFCDEMQKYSWEQEYFEECMGHMNLFLRDKWMAYFLGVFVMEIDYSGWKPICRVDLGGLANQYRDGGRFYSFHHRILKVVVEGEDELKALILLPDKIVSLDLKKMKFEEICDCGWGQFTQSPQPAYIGSLAHV